MNFNAPLFKPVRILLFPFSLIYGLIIWIRNRLFDYGILESSSFNLPLICVGNLAAGGTGKTPMVVYLASELKDRFKVAILSRGYKRKTRGYALAHPNTNALEIGDEPMLFYNKFPDLSIAVGEQRLVAIPQLLHDKPEVEVILLDDAFQHRSVKAGLNIILTDYNNLFTRDWFLPTGDLRDEKSAYKRAGIIIVTKCPQNITQEEIDDITREIKLLDHQHIFFTGIEYGLPYHILTRAPYIFNASSEVLLISGIANPAPLKSYLQEQVGSYEEILYSDHHIFTIDDWKEMNKRFSELNSPEKIILTTEKDAVRLLKFDKQIMDIPFYVLPIKINFLCGHENHFNHLIETYILQFRQKKIENAKEKIHKEESNEFGS